MKTIKKHALFLALFTLAGTFFGPGLFAQNRISMEPLGERKGKENPIRLSELSANVEIMGNIATTKLDMLFVNKGNQILEGQLDFPLGQNESVVGYALDINGKMRDGVVVEKDKGRQVFEAVVRQGIDPGLVEKTSGNNFRTRVYPFPANGSRRVQITYQSELKSQAWAANMEAPEYYTYVFSALPKGRLDKFDFTITVLDQETSPHSWANNQDGMDSFSFERMRGGRTASISKTDIELTKPIQFSLESNSVAKTSHAYERPVFIQTLGKDTYFYYSRTLAAFGQEKPLPKTIAVLWDVSSSGQKRDIDRELQLLKAYVKELENPTVRVFPFSIKIHDGRSFKIEGEADIDKLEKFIRSFSYDGATNLSYDFSALETEEVLVFSDGLANWSEASAAPADKKLARVYAINSSASADHAWLSSIANARGGQYINLCGAGEKIDDKLWDLTHEPYRLIRAEYDGGAIEQVYPLDGTIVGHDFSLCGLLKKKSSKVTLRFGHGNKVEESVSFDVSAVDGIETVQAARQWAVKKIDSLSQSYGKNKDQIISLAKKFGVVTKDTSLIVLDSASDYVRYGIVPPESDKELRAEYDRIVGRGGAAFKPVDGGQDKKVPESVYRYFEGFRKWWNTSPKEFKEMKKEKGRQESRRPAASQNASESVYDDAAVLSETLEVNSFEGVSNSYDGAPPVTMRLNRASKSADVAHSSGGQSKIQLEAWSPNSKYLADLKKTPTELMYDKYFELKKEYESSPAFYMEVSDYFFEEGKHDWALRVLSNLAEMDLENTDILRALANKLVERKMHSLAVPVFERLVQLRPETPQFLRDLGLAYWQMGEAQKAVDSLYSVACKKWDPRFDEIQQIVLNDMNAIIASCERDKITLDLSAIDKDLKQNFDMDVRVVLTWNTDNCDIDLWVTDKDGEKCFYSNKLTANGGRLSRDFTQGYGPEEFCIKKFPGGKLKIEANYFANHQQKFLQPVTVQAEVYTNFGRPNQKKEILTLQLVDKKEVFLIGNVEW